MGATSLIRIDLIRAFLVLAPWALLLVLLVNWLDIMVHFDNADQSRMQSFISGLIFSAAISAFFWIFFHPPLYNIVALFFGYLFYWFLFLSRGSGFLNYVRPRFGRVGMLLFLIMVFGGTMALMAGRIDAESKDEFLVRADSESLVILRVYGSLVVSAPYDSNSRLVKPRFRLDPIEKLSGIELTLSKIGPLESETIQSITKASTATR